MTEGYKVTIPELHKERGVQVASYIDTLTKPIGSLGRLESIAIELAEMTGDDFPEVTPPAAIVFAADHGITDEGVSAYPKEVTAQMVTNFLQGGAAMNIFCDQINALFTIVDVGVAEHIEHEQLTSEKVRHGTRNFYREDAMTEEEAITALRIGKKEVEKMIAKGAKSVIVGEMGIGNTSAASAIIAVATGQPIETIIGPGTGLSTEGMQHKARILKEALQNRNPDINDSIDILKKVGGYEIAAMAGAMLEAAKNELPIIVDGLICTSAALIAKGINKRVTDYMFIGHRSLEPGHDGALASLQKEPLLDLQLHLGEGTGAALAFPLIESAVNMLRRMATFQDAGVSEKSGE